MKKIFFLTEFFITDEENSIWTGTGYLQSGKNLISELKHETMKPCQLIRFPGFHQNGEFV
jgi:hypothetical protein